VVRGGGKGGKKDRAPSTLRLWCDGREEKEKRHKGTQGKKAFTLFAPRKKKKKGGKRKPVSLEVERTCPRKSPEEGKEGKKDAEIIHKPQGGGERVVTLSTISLLEREKGRTGWNEPDFLLYPRKKRGSMSTCLPLSPGRGKEKRYVPTPDS